MLGRTVLATLTIFVAAMLESRSCSAQQSESTADGTKKVPAFWFKIRGDREPERRLQFRRDADAMREIDALAVIKEKFVAKDAKPWPEIHLAIAEYVGNEGEEQKLHIRFYHSDYLRTRVLIKDLHAEVRRKLSDLSISIVMIDETVIG